MWLEFNPFIVLNWSRCDFTMCLLIAIGNLQ